MKTNQLIKVIERHQITVARIVGAICILCCLTTMGVCIKEAIKIYATSGWTTSCIALCATTVPFIAIMIVAGIYLLFKK